MERTEKVTPSGGDTLSKALPLGGQFHRRLPGAHVASLCQAADAPILELEEAAQGAQVRVEHGLGPVPQTASVRGSPEVSPPQTEGRKAPFWMGAPSLSLTTSPLPPSLSLSPHQPLQAAGEFSQAGGRHLEAGLGARRVWRREPRGCQQGSLLHGSGLDPTFQLSYVVTLVQPRSAQCELF